MPVIFSAHWASLGWPSLFAVEIGTELLEAHRVAVEEGLVMESLDQQRVAERQHQRGVGAGPDRQPFDVAAGVEVVGRRRHIDEADTGVAQAEEAALDVVHDGAARVDLGVLARHAAEGDEKPAVPGEHLPARVAGQQLLERRHDMRHQDEGGADAVVIHVAHVAADQVEEAMQLALGVMETPGACPAVGAAEDRPVAEIALHAAELARHQVERFVPRHFDEGLGAAPLREGAGTMLEPALAHGGTAHAQARHLVGQHMQADRRGIGILREGMKMDGLAGLVVFDFVDAPMRQGERALMRHGNGFPEGACGFAADPR